MYSNKKNKKKIILISILLFMWKCRFPCTSRYYTYTYGFLYVNNDKYVCRFVVCMSIKCKQLVRSIESRKMWVPYVLN